MRWSKHPRLTTFFSDFLHLPPLCLDSQGRFESVSNTTVKFEGGGMWRAVYDSSHGCYYYEHSDGKESTWTRPLDYAPRAEDFEERFDEETQRMIYFDKTTGKRRHIRPVCLLPPAILLSPPTAMASPRGSLPPTHPPLSGRLPRRSLRLHHAGDDERSYFRFRRTLLRRCQPQSCAICHRLHPVALLRPFPGLVSLEDREEGQGWASPSTTRCYPGKAS